MPAKGIAGDITGPGLLLSAVLALLAQSESHGYVLVQRLGELGLFADAPPDTSGVYKVLKSMEGEGLVTAAWEMGDSGPAKRQCTITTDGRTCLARWAQALKEYRRQIGGPLGILGNCERRPM